MSERYFLGLDSSTQSLKATLLDEELAIVRETSLNFDADLPEFGTDGGAIRGDDGLTVTSPAIMWVAALDMILERMKADDWPLAQVAAISGSGQQHGSVWLKQGTRDILSHLDPASSLREQLESAFSIPDSPIWMDSSTGKQCAELEAAMGGAQRVADLTGSRAYERFTRNQIAKLATQQPEAYAQTEHICLVSSFVASLLIGDYAPIDWSDGSGMNLLNIRTKQWEPEILDATAPELAQRLGESAPSHAVAGCVSAYLATCFGFDPACRVIAFTGDNPNSFAGLRIAEPGELALSLGTSITIFGSLSEPKPSANEGHIFVNPVDPDAYMAMLCMKNGTLTVQRIRDRVAHGDWGRFAELMAQSPVGNNGQIGIYIDDPEITPPIETRGHYRFDANGDAVETFDAASEVRAVVESQFLSMRLHGRNVGLVPSSILATGGASRDMTVLRIMSDVFGVPVHVAEQTDSASLGAAYRARHGWLCAEAGKTVPFAEVVASAPPFRKAVDPDMDAHAVYTEMLDRYEALEASLLG